MKFRAILMLVLFLGLFSISQAQENLPVKKSVLVGFSLKNNNIQSLDKTFNNVPIGSAYIGWYMDDKFKIEGNIGTSINTEVNAYDIDLGAAYVTNISLKNVQPFISSGVGITQLQYHDDASTTASNYRVYIGAGVDWFIAPGLSVGGTYTAGWQYDGYIKKGSFATNSVGANVKFILF